MIIRNSLFCIILVFLSSTGAAQDRPIGDDIQVNTTTLGNQNEPDIEALIDGGFVVAWHSGPEVRGQIFEADGSRRGEEFIISQTFRVYLPQVTVLGLADGSFVVAWQASPQTTFRRFGSDGAPISDEMFASVEFHGGDIRMDRLVNGGFVIVWKKSDTADIIGRVFDANGQPTTDEIILNNNVAGTQEYPDVAGLPNGNFIVVWADDSGEYSGDNGDEIVGRVFRPDGTAASDYFQVNEVVEGNQARPRVEANDDVALVTWEHGRARSISGRLVGFSGQFLTEEFSHGFTTNWVHDSAPVGNTGFAIATTRGGSGADAFLSRVFADGVNADRDVRVNSILRDNQWKPRVAYLENGNLALAWEDSSLACCDQDGTAVRARLVELIDPTEGTLTVELLGLGTGTVQSDPQGVSCSPGLVCSNSFPFGSAVTLSANAAVDSRFSSWSPRCVDTQADDCQTRVLGGASLSARFELRNVPAGRIVGSILPGARSGYVGGPSVTAFMSIVSRATTPAQSCRITAPNGAPVTLRYQRLNPSGVPIGAANPVFDLQAGGTASLLLTLTPIAETGTQSFTLFPDVVCENARLVPINGVNSLLVSAGLSALPDILSIAATPSGDGIITIPTTGNRVSFMTVAAVNIGAGDGQFADNSANVSVSVDTGDATLPVTLDICETNSLGVCQAARSSGPLDLVFSPNEAKYFAVFVRGDEGSLIPFSPADSRVFMRFRSASATRSVTSAAVQTAE